MKKLSRNNIRLILAVSAFLLAGILFLCGYYFVYSVVQMVDMSIKSTYAAVTINAPQNGHYKISKVTNPDKIILQQGTIPDSFRMPVGYYRVELSQGGQTISGNILFSPQANLNLPEEFLKSPLLNKDSVSELFVGKLYELGWGFPKDEATAVKWYKKAADDGSIIAQVYIGEYYQEGRGGLGQGYVRAMEWYKKASDQGSAEADYNIGQLYFNGLGVPKDKKEAVKWYQRAADDSSISAELKLGFLYERGGEGVDKDIAKAIELFKEASEAVPDETNESDDNVNKGAADNELGMLYDDGVEVPLDLTAAIVWYQKAAVKGNAPAMYQLGEMYLTGKGVQLDEAVAKVWIKKAADQGYPAAVDALKKMP